MKIRKFIQSILPGIFLFGFTIGTGSVTAMAKAGATYGMSLLWTVCISCIVTYYMIMIYGRYTIVTGETALYAFRHHIHPGVGIFFIVGLTVAVSGSVIGVMGIMSDICYEWSKNLISGGINQLYFSIFFISVVYWLFWHGRTKFFEKAMAVIVGVMSVSFILNFFVMRPPSIEILKGLIPNIPVVAEDQGKAPFLLLASMVGTTVFTGLFIIRTTLVKEEGWGIGDMKIQKRDAFLSALLMFIISASIMAAAAGTLYANNIGLTDASQMVELLEPLAGRLATSIFVCGVVAAGVSSQLPNVLMLPWLLCDYNNSKRDMTFTKYRVMVLIISLLGLIVPIFKAPPVLVMIASQVFSAIILPVTVLCILYLGNKKSVMKEYTNTISTNIILSLILAFALFVCVSGIRGLLGITL